MISADGIFKIRLDLNDLNCDLRFRVKKKKIFFKFSGVLTFVVDVHGWGRKLVNHCSTSEMKGKGGGTT